MSADTSPHTESQSAALDKSWHLPTAVAVGAISWLLLMVGHEVIGHGAGCLGVGGEALYFDAMYFQCSDLPQLWQDQVYRASGSLFNLLLVIVSVLCLRFVSSHQTWTGFLLWITAITNSLQAGSYVGFGRFIHPGMDWPTIVAAAPPGPWNLVVTTAGLGMIALAFWIGWKYQPSFLLQGHSGPWQRLRLLLIPYLTATVIAVAASLLVPSEDRLMMLMGGIGNSLFFLAPMLLIAALPARAKGRNLDLSANGPLIFVAAIAVALYLVFMAPGVTLAP